MEHENINIIGRFFEAYSRHDLKDIQKVLSEKVRWVFPGQNPLSGTKEGIDEVISFFDKMGSIMGKSNTDVKSLVMGAADEYVIECQHIKTKREDCVNLDQDVCVLWVFKDGKIIEGKHFISDQSKADDFFNFVHTADGR